MEFATIEEIFNEIDRTRDKLVAKVSALAGEHAAFQSAPEVWSVAHAVEHLAKTETSLVNLIGKLLAKAEAENIPSSGKIEPPVSFAEIAVKARGQKFQAPEAIRPGGAATIAESLRSLEQSRAALRELRPRLEAVDLSNVSFPHPAFGAMNLYYWLAFIGLHEARHLRQIVEITDAFEHNKAAN